MPAIAISTHHTTQAPPQQKGYPNSSLFSQLSYRGGYPHKRLASSRSLGHTKNGSALFSYINGVVTPHMTISVTNTKVTRNSAADDGAADQGMDCT
ncbi:hypothetical protein AB7M23_000923 [Pseudomonas sp. HLS-6 TE3448]